MAIEHVDIPDGERHEPKGASSALVGTVYTADGNGSGDWVYAQLKGQSTAQTGMVPYKNPLGITWATPFTPSYCEVDAAESIKSLTGSTEITVNGAVFDNVVAGDFTLTGGDTLTINKAGVYHTYFAIKLAPQTALSSSNEIIEARLKVNGTVSNPYRVVPITILRNAAIHDPFIITGCRIIEFSAGDTVTMTLKNLAATRSYKVVVNFGMFKVG